MNDRIRNILVIEDDEDLQTVYQMILRSQGYRVEIACDGIEGLLMLKTFTPDLILLDYFMPRMDGRTFLQNYNAADFPDTKVVATTNVSDAEVLGELLSLGAHRTVLKADLSPSELLALADEVLT